MAVRRHRFPSLIEQTEPDSRLDGLVGGDLVEAEIQGYKLLDDGSNTIGEVHDKPGATPCAERARLDALAVVEFRLGARVAVDVEQVVSGHSSTGDC